MVPFEHNKITSDCPHNLNSVYIYKKKKSQAMNLGPGMKQCHSKSWPAEVALNCPSRGDEITMPQLGGLCSYVLLLPNL